MIGTAKGFRAISPEILLPHTHMIVCGRNLQRIWNMLYGTCWMYGTCLLEVPRLGDIFRMPRVPGTFQKSRELGISHRTTAFGNFSCA